MLVQTAAVRNTHLFYMWLVLWRGDLVRLALLEVLFYLGSAFFTFPTFQTGRNVLNTLITIVLRASPAPPSYTYRSWEQQSLLVFWITVTHSNRAIIRLTSCEEQLKTLRYMYKWKRARFKSLTRFTLSVSVAVLHRDSLKMLLNLFQFSGVMLPSSSVNGNNTSSFN